MVTEYAEKEKNYEDLDRLMLLCRVPIPRTFITLEVFDKDGKLLQYLKQRSHSWTRNAYNQLFCQIGAKNPNDATFGAGLLSIKDTAGVVKYSALPVTFYRSVSVDGVDQGYRAPAGIDSRGILVGSLGTAESFEDYVLATLITNGTGAGQLAYGESEAHAVTYVAGTKVLTNTLIRYFNNNSGGDVSVNEVALVMYAIIVNAYYNWLMSRDVLGATITVPNTGQLKVTYTISLTYPA